MEFMYLEEKLKNYSWHDCPVYSCKFDDNFSLDIDYILEWKLGEDNKYTYLIAPAILEFTVANNLSFLKILDFKQEALHKCIFLVK